MSAGLGLHLSGSIPGSCVHAGGFHAAANWQRGDIWNLTIEENYRLSNVGSTILSHLNCFRRIAINTFMPNSAPVRNIAVGNLLSSVNLGPNRKPALLNERGAI